MPDDDMRHELVRGLLVTLPFSGGEHGEIAGNIVHQIVLYDPDRKLGRMLGGTGFRVESGPDTVRVPDVAFVSAARLSQVRTKGYPAVSPDLAVEVLSPSNSATEMIQKVDEYLKAGSRLVWIVDPETRSVTVWTKDGAARPLHEEDQLDGGDVLPGFTCRVGDLFT